MHFSFSISLPLSIFCSHKPPTISESAGNPLHALPRMYVVFAVLRLYLLRCYQIFQPNYRPTASSQHNSARMGERGIEPPMFTTRERIYSPPQHHQSLPFALNFLCIAKNIRKEAVGTLFARATPTGGIEPPFYTKLAPYAMIGIWTPEPFTVSKFSRPPPRPTGLMAKRNGWDLNP